MKRTIASVLTALVMALALSGCGSSKEPDTKLTIWTNMSVEAETIQSYADEWVSLCPRIINVVNFAHRE